MNAAELFPSKYVAACDLKGQVVTVTIAGVRLEELQNTSGKETKGVIYFQGCKKGMVLNKVNGNRIITLYGQETDAWIGKQIMLYPSEADFQGNTVPCIRVKAEVPVQAGTRQPPTTISQPLGHTTANGNGQQPDSEAAPLAGWEQPQHGGGWS